MNRHVSSRLEMGARALEFSRAHPFDSPGYTPDRPTHQGHPRRAVKSSRQHDHGTSRCQVGNGNRHRCPGGGSRIPTIVKDKLGQACQPPVGPVAMYNPHPSGSIRSPQEGGPPVP